LPAARHSSQPLKAYKPKINSKISSEIWLPTCFLPTNLLRTTPTDFLIKQPLNNVINVKKTNIKTLQHKTLSLSLSLSSETPKNKNFTKKNLVKQTWKFAQFFHRTKASRIFDTHPKK
jgi:hypothetical protein